MRRGQKIFVAWLCLLVGWIAKGFGMIKYLLSLFGYEIVYQCEWGVFRERYRSLDEMMGRPIHPDMSIAPPWAKARLVAIDEDWCK